MLKTQLLNDQNLLMEEEMNEKELEVNRLKDLLKRLEKENTENIEMVEKSDQGNNPKKDLYLPWICTYKSCFLFIDIWSYRQTKKSVNGSF